MNTTDEIKAANPIESVFQRYGITEWKPQGGEMYCICPFHDDSKPSMRVNFDKGLFTCDACGAGGDVIAFVQRKEACNFQEAMEKLGATPNPEARHPAKSPRIPLERPEIEKTYPYTDWGFNTVYEVVRLRPKSFRQRHKVDGKWVWNMEGVERILYNLPAVSKSPLVFVVEGEKDADRLGAEGLVATCNVGGAGKWLDSYTETLAGKEVVIVPDNDEAGQKHCEVVKASLAGKIKTLRVIELPDGIKDVSDYLDGPGDWVSFEQMVVDAPLYSRGIDLPVYSAAEMESRYRDLIKKSEGKTLDLSKWLPAFSALRPVVPGELVTIVADTGVGKSAILQNIAVNATDMSVLVFSLELPDPIVFERLVSITTATPGYTVEDSYATGGGQNTAGFTHIHCCPEAGLTPSQIESLIIKSELKIGERPGVVMVDYIGLISGVGKRYERVSDAAEAFKVIAKRLNIIVVLASQIHRKEGEGVCTPISLHDAKDSGSVENSSQLMIGAWRNDHDPTKELVVKVMKGTRGGAGLRVLCHISPHLCITQHSVMEHTKTGVNEDENQGHLDYLK